MKRVEDLKVYQLNKGDDGIYLLVKKDNGSPFPRKLEKLYYELNQRKISYDPNVIKDIFIQAQGVPEKIASLDGKQIYSPLFELRITSDKMNADLIVYPSLKDKDIETAEIERFLIRNGVKYGVKREKIPQIVKWRPHYHEWLIAEGKPNVNGNDAYLKFYFQKDGLDLKPKVLENGRVDFYDLNIIQVVETGMTLVERIPPTEGINGINVLGAEFKGKPGKDVRLPVGANTQIIENNTKLISTKKGHISFANDKVNIYPTYEVNGDVDFNTGNIDFPGNVIIRGDVKNTFSVKAGGDVEIYGNLAGTVIAGGNLNIRKGIIQGKAEVMGNIYVRYIENGTAISKENIIVSEAIMHSTVKTQKKLSVGGKKGLIVGGYISAKEEISAKNIGSPMGTNTHLEVGINPELVDEYKILCTRLKHLQENIEKSQRLIDSFQKMQEKGMLSADKNALYLKVWETQYQTEKEIDDLLNKKNELETKFEEIGDVSIKVMNTIYSGVVINIGKYSLLILEEKYRVVFRVDGYEIRGFNL